MDPKERLKHVLKGINIGIDANDNNNKQFEAIKIINDFWVVVLAKSIIIRVNAIIEPVNKPIAIPFLSMSSICILKTSKLKTYLSYKTPSNLAI